jgi:hypothetical protein
MQGSSTAEGLGLKRITLQRQQGTSQLLFVFSLCQRKNEQQKEIKYRPA